MNNMQRKLVDASVMLGFLNQDDEHHSRSMQFMQSIFAANTPQPTITLIFPMHALIEINTKLRKIKKENKWRGISPLEMAGPIFYPITRNLIDKIESENLYDLFLHKLGSQDAIYAAIAYLENIPLVTADNGFSKVSDIITVELV